MKSSQVIIGASALASQYNNLRQDAFGGSFLLPREQATPDLTLRIENGACYVGATRIIFTGGNSPSFTAPVTNPRIDLLTIDSTGVLARVVGTEAVSPTAPAYPTDKLVICEVYNRVGQTTIRDVDTVGQGYIYNDVRPFLGGTYISLASQIADGIITDIKLASTFVKTSTDQTVAGIKTFSSIPVLPASDPTTDNQAARKFYVDNTPKTKLSLITTPVTVTNTTVETNLISVSIPAGTLGTANAIRVVLNISNLTAGASNFIVFNFKYGATTLITFSPTINASPSSGRIEFDLFATGATNSQKGTSSLMCIIGSNSNENYVRTDTGTAVIDSTVAQNLVISVSWGGASILNVITMDSAIVEKII